MYTCRRRSRAFGRSKSKSNRSRKSRSRSSKRRRSMSLSVPQSISFGTRIKEGDILHTGKDLMTRAANIPKKDLQVVKRNERGELYIIMNGKEQIIRYDQNNPSHFLLIELCSLGRNDKGPYMTAKNGMYKNKKLGIVYTIMPNTYFVNKHIRHFNLTLPEDESLDNVINSKQHWDILQEALDNF